MGKAFWRPYLLHPSGSHVWESVSVALWSVDSAGAVSGAGYNELSGERVSGWSVVGNKTGQSSTNYPHLNSTSCLALKASALPTMLLELLTITAPMAKTSSPTIPVKGMR